MPTFSPSDGVNETEPTLVSEGSLNDTDGAEYRVGEMGLFVARGRDNIGSLGSVTGRGLYEAGFDSSSGYIIAQQGNSLHAAKVASTLTFSLIENLPTGSSQIVGAHQADRHYLATGKANKRIEFIPENPAMGTAEGVTSFPIGMSTTTLVVGVSVTQAGGSISATTGLEYWVTEYDSTRGIESVFGSTANTGVFSDLDSVIVTVTGVSSNPRADKLRWYRSTDGGGYPDGGLIQTTAIGVTSITDTSTNTGTLTVPQYGIISLGGLDTDRDEAPPVLDLIFGPFQDSLLGVSGAEPRVLRFTPAGYPDSWPSAYGIPLDTARQDKIIAGVVLPGRIGVFCNDSAHVIYRLPRDADSVFAAGEMSEVLTNARGAMSRRGATVFTPPGSGPLAAWVSRDGIWASNMSSSPVPLTDKVKWETRVDVTQLPNCRLVDDPLNRRLVFIHHRMSDSSHNTGIWYLDYQRFSEVGIRITFADHGPLADAVTVAAPDGLRRLLSLDSRASNGQVYIEANQDVDDSQLRDSSGSVRFRMKTKEFLPTLPSKTVRLGNATWMHDAGPSKILHRFYHDRQDSNPDIKEIPNPTTRNAGSVALQKSVNSLSLEIESTGTVSYGVHWIDIETFEGGQLGGRKGA